MSFRPAIIGAFSPTTLACVRTWGRLGWSPGLLAVGGPDETPPASRYLAFSGALPKADVGTESGLRAVESFVHAHAPTALLSVDEGTSTWLDANRARLEQKTKLWLPPAAALTRSLSKEQQVELAAKVGFVQLPTYAITLGKPLPDIPAEQFPLCLRPAKAGWVRPHFKVARVAGRRELDDFFYSLTATDEPVLAQPFRDVPNLVVHGARTADGHTIGLAAFLVRRKFEGVTLTIEPCALPDGIAAKCRLFTAELGLVGNYHFEFLHDPASGESCFLELNPRFGGTTAKVLALGYAEAAYAVQAFGGPQAEAAAAPRGLAGNRLALLKCAGATLRGQVSPLDYPSLPAWRKLTDILSLLPGLRDEVLCTDDLAGAAGLYRATLAGGMRTLRAKLAGTGA